MISKSVFISVAAAASAAACVAPVFAGPGNVYGAPFYCQHASENSFFADGGFAKWVSKNGVRVFNFSGDPTGEWSAVGMRLNFKNFSNSKALKFTWDTTNSNDAHLGVMYYSNLTGDSFGVRYDFINYDDGNYWGPDYGLVGVPINRNSNVYRFTFTPQTAEYYSVEPSTAYQTVWLYDVTWPDNYYGNESIYNVSENGIAIGQDVNTSANYDCSPSRLPKAC